MYERCTWVDRLDCLCWSELWLFTCFCNSLLIALEKNNNTN